MTQEKDYAVRLLGIIAADADSIEELRAYAAGRHRDPYMPQNADQEYRLLAERSITNLMPLAINGPVQAMYVDGYHSNSASGKTDFGAGDAEWGHFQRSRGDKLQVSVHRAACIYGHSFTLTLPSEKFGGKARTVGLSPTKTAALFEDAANDVEPIVALTVVKPVRRQGEKILSVGLARMWDDTYEYEVAFESLTDPKKIRVGAGVEHGAGENPVTRFTCEVDLDGVTTGIVGPLIPVQDRFNQDIFDLLIAQSYGAHQVRTATGMAPPVAMKPVLGPDGKPTGEVVPDLDPETGMPRPLRPRLKAGDILYSEDADSRWGSIPGTPLGGYIESISATLRHFVALGQTPPHYALGEIANLSAEALKAAMISLDRRVAELKVSFGESWERVLRLGSKIDGVDMGSDDYSGEVRWRGMDDSAFAAIADGLNKLLDIGVPVQGLWERIPGVTQQELASWRELKDEESTNAMSDLGSSLDRVARSTLLGGLTNGSSQAVPQGDGGAAG